MLDERSLLHRDATANRAMARATLSCPPRSLQTKPNPSHPIKIEVSRTPSLSQMCSYRRKPQTLATEPQTLEKNSCHSISNLRKKLSPPQTPPLRTMKKNSENLILLLPQFFPNLNPSSVLSNLSSLVFHPKSSRL